MKIRRLLPVLGAFAVGLLAAEAHAANTWIVDCGAGTIQENSNTAQSGFTASNALGTVLGTPSGPATTGNAAQSGDTVKINGVCSEDVTVRTSGLTIEDETNGVASVNTGTAIEGQLEFNGAVRITLGGIELGSHSGSFSFPGSGENANLYVHGDSSLLVENCDVENGPLDGILVSSNSSIKLLSVIVSANGTLGTARQAEGVRIVGGGYAFLGNNDGTDGVIIKGNAGNGLQVIGGGADIYGSVIDNNGKYQVEFFGSLGYITDTQICAGTGPDSGSACTPSGSGSLAALGVAGGSHVQIDAFVGANTITGPNTAWRSSRRETALR
jgi:hypothetical protein